jgi:hypothetical protein
MQESCNMPGFVVSPWLEQPLSTSLLSLSWTTLIVL